MRERPGQQANSAVNPPQSRPRLRRTSRGRVTQVKADAGQADHLGMLCPRPTLAVLAALLAAACGNAAAAPVTPRATAAGQPPESVQLVQRLTEQADTAVPDVTGLTRAEAKKALTERGLQVQAVRLRPRARRVSAQWPSAGTTLPSDGSAVIWVGTPPAPPPPPAQHPIASSPPADQPALPPPPAPPADSDVGSGVTPGLEDFVAPPPPRRANIRTLPAADTGTRLSGRASWYGPGFQGRTTACGGTFDPGQRTLASRELRCGTTVLVTAANGRSVEATVTDWGPAEWTKRRFDLSQATFTAIAGLGAGVIDVTVEVR